MAGVVALLALSACGSYVERGRALYGERRFVEAAEVFERTETRLRNATDEQRAEYGLYRGATLLRLGDLKRSQRWLSFAYDVERSKPDALQPEDRALLDRSWDELSRRLQTAVQPEQQRAATAASGLSLAESNNRTAPGPSDPRTPRPSAGASGSTGSRRITP